jgi:hypothetical protein
MSPSSSTMKGMMMRWWSTAAARNHPPRPTTMVRSTSSFHSSQRFQSTATVSSSTTTDSSHTTTPSSTFVPYPVVRKDDFGPNQEYSVIHTDRSLNLMSIPFQTVMKDLYHCFNHTYRAAHTIIIPGYVFVFLFILGWIFYLCITCTVLDGILQS